MTIETLAEALKAGSISLSEWTAQMRALVLEELTVAMDVAKGGRKFITPNDWGFVGSQAKKQYALLDGFAADIQADPGKWLRGRRLNARANLYGQVGYSALQEDLSREKEKSGWTEYRSVLDPAPGVVHCETCLSEASKGWVKIGTLIPIGQRDCTTNDRCGFEYRKTDGNGGWIYG